MRGTDISKHRQTRHRTAPRAAACGVVVACPRSPSENPQSHESVTRHAIAARLAALKGYEFGGDYDENADYDGALYFVPGATLVGGESARALGIRSEDDLFGGVVPLPFVGTKTITHDLLGADAIAPPGWSEGFATAVREAVLPGYSAFSRVDAIRAGARLLATGAVRVKPALGIGGRGQVVARDADSLEEAIHGLDRAELARYGVVLEQNLNGVTTYSVGQVRVADLVATYFGTQKLARDLQGLEVYGGSDLTVARGDFDALLELDLDAEARLAIEQARTYDAAARRHFDGFFASRCNYDIASGADREGRVRSGVLEQSWRIGGASSAEVAALEAFREDPDVRAVRAECTEVYGPDAEPPLTATVYFRGLDAELGFITKYTTLETYVDA